MRGHSRTKKWRFPSPVCDRKKESALLKLSIAETEPVLSHSLRAQTAQGRKILLTAVRAPEHRSRRPRLLRVARPAERSTLRRVATGIRARIRSRPLRLCCVFPRRKRLLLISPPRAHGSRVQKNGFHRNGSPQPRSHPRILRPSHALCAPPPSFARSLEPESGTCPPSLPNRTPLI
jgi:hypothetical protein